MANILILGGSFGGVVAAEEVARRAEGEHRITLISNSDEFLFYPALVRFAFGDCERKDVSLDLREAMMSRGVNFIKADVARVNPYARRVTLAHGEVEGEPSYDYLIYALGRRLATERVAGFYEHAHHTLTLEAALRFREAVANFHEGHAVVGSCPGARLPVPVYETAFRLDRELKQRGEREMTRITIVDPEASGLERFAGSDTAQRIYAAMRERHIELVPDFPVSRVTAHYLQTARGEVTPYDLLMLVPPFTGSGPAMHARITDSNNFIRVDEHMRVLEVERMYAAGDATNLPGPRTGHMAVRQAEVAAENLAAELEGRAPTARYQHEMRLVIDTGAGDSLHVRRTLRGERTDDAGQSVFWRWAKQAHERLWLYKHA